MDSKTIAMRAFFAACNAGGLSEAERHAIVESYGHESTTEMTEQELQDATRVLYGKEQKDEERGKWVRRCMAVVYAHCERNGFTKVGPDYVKSIITTSARGLSFNKLTVEQLTKVYNTFKRKNNGGK